MRLQLSVRVPHLFTRLVGLTTNKTARFLVTEPLCGELTWNHLRPGFPHRTAFLSILTTLTLFTFITRPSPPPPPPHTHTHHTTPRRTRLLGGGGELCWFHSVRPFVGPSIISCTLCKSHSSGWILSILDTRMRGSVVHNDLWSSPIFSRSFSHNLAEIWHILPCPPRACIILDGLFPY